MTATEQSLIHDQVYLLSQTVETTDRDCERCNHSFALVLHVDEAGNESWTGGTKIRDKWICVSCIPDEVDDWAMDMAAAASDPQPPNPHFQPLPPEQVRAMEIAELADLASLAGEFEPEAAHG